MCKIVILFVSTSKMCKIGLQAADYKITSLVLCNTLYSVWHKDTSRSEFISNGRAFGMNAKVLGWKPLEWDIFCHKKLFRKNIYRYSLVENECCRMSILNANITN